MINFMKKNKIINSSKCDNNIKLLFNSSAQYAYGLVYITNIEKYNSGHSVVELKHIDDKWYYFKNK